MSKVINTILSLKDQMSGPMLNATKVVKEASAKVQEAKNQLRQHQEAAVKNSEAVTVAKTKIAEMTATFGKNSHEVSQAKNQLAEHQRVLKESNERVKEAASKVREYSSALTNASKKIKEAQNKVNEFGKKSLETMDKLVAKTIKWGVGIATAVGGLALKTGFTEAFDMEGYKTQLVTAVKDTQKAGELMTDAVKVANSTPFETGSVVQATASLEALGLSSKKWLVDVADMAGGTNESIDRATQAVINATKGQFEMLKAFGIDSKMLQLEAEQMFGKDVVFSKSGQVKDMVKLEEVLQATMQKKFKGGAEAQSKTVRGMWSTVTGVTKSALAKIVGMQEDGTVKQGSLLELLKEKISKIIELINKCMEDGTVTKIAEQVTVAVGNIISFFTYFFSFISKWGWAIEIVVVFIGTIYLVIKVFYFLKAALVVVNVIMMLLNGTLLISPLGWIAIIIGVVIAAAYALWRNFDSLVKIFEDAWNWLKNLVDGTSSFALALTGPLAPILLLIKHFDDLKDAASGAWNWIKNIFGGGEEGVSVDVGNEKPDKKSATPKNFPKIPTPKLENKNPGGVAAGNNLQTQRVEQKTEININMPGDVYGYDDFSEKISEAVVKAFDRNSPNVVGV